MATFEESLNFGNNGEMMAMHFMLKCWDYSILHISKIQEVRGGAKLYLPVGYTPATIPSPDFLLFKRAGSMSAFQGLPPRLFTDLKTKRKASFYRLNNRWQTGIDKRHRNNYLQCRAITNIPVWILHLILPTSLEDVIKQRVPQDKLPAPTGLFGCSVELKPSDESEKMVYWGIQDMVQLATLEQVLNAQPKQVPPDKAS